MSMNNFDAFRFISTAIGGLWLMIGLYRYVVTYGDEWYFGRMAATRRIISGMVITCYHPMLSILSCVGIEVSRLASAIILVAADIVIRYPVYCSRVEDISDYIVSRLKRKNSVSSHGSEP